VNPGFHRTGLVANTDATIGRAYEGLEPSIRDQYGDKYRETMVSMTSNAIEPWAWDPKNVTRALTHAVTAREPRIQYLVGESSVPPLFNMLVLSVLYGADLSAAVYRDLAGADAKYTLWLVGVMTPRLRERILRLVAPIHRLVPAAMMARGKAAAVSKGCVVMIVPVVTFVPLRRLTSCVLCCMGSSQA
jgi:hypothetical protein